MRHPVSHSMKSVVITRPLAQALPLAQRVAALGREVQVLPLLEILPLDDDTQLRAVLADLSRFALVAFVSPNAIDACMAWVPVWPPGVALAVMGEGSRAALAAHGINDQNATIYSPQDPQRTDSSTLLAALNLTHLQNAQVLIIRGESGREFLADALRTAGVQVRQIAAYRRQIPVLDAAKKAQLIALLATENEWLITSSEGLRNLIELTQQLEAEPQAQSDAQSDAQSGANPERVQFVAKLQQQHLIVPHARIAEVAHSLGFDKVSLVGSGDEALLVAVQSCL